MRKESFWASKLVKNLRECEREVPHCHGHSVMGDICVGVGFISHPGEIGPSGGHWTVQ
jgi:hypothetical protein